jgi:hypothetical protein
LRQWFAILNAETEMFGSELAKRNPTGRIAILAVATAASLAITTTAAAEGDGLRQSDYILKSNCPHRTVNLITGLEDCGDL